MTDTNNKAPTTWIHIKFNEAIDLIPTSKIKIKQKDYLPFGEFPVVDQGAQLIGGYTNDRSKIISVSKPVIIFGDHTKVIKYIFQKFAPGADGIKVLKTKDFFDAKLFYYFTQFIASSLVDKGYSRHFQFLNKATLPVPPVQEQKRIVEKIEELFSELDEAEKNLIRAQKLLSVYRQSLLQHAFEGKLTEKWRQQTSENLLSPQELMEFIQNERTSSYHKKFQLWESSKKGNVNLTKPKQLKKYSPISSEVLNTLPVLPSEWFWGKLGWVTCGVEYGTSAKSNKTGDIAVLRMGNIQNGKFDWTNLVFTSDKLEINKYILTHNDVLFNRTNSPELVGKTAIYKSEQPAIFAGYLIRINQIQTIVDPQFLNLFLNSHIAKKYGHSVKTDGVNQSNINGEKLSNYPFPFCTVKEQKVIVSILEENLSKMEYLDAEINSQLQKLKALRQSILEKAFSGQLVHQNPDEEPAHELLARIKSEQTNQKNQKTKPIKRQKVTT